MLSLVLGATVSASTIVLATFMAGFSLGAYLLGKIVNDSLKPGRLFSFLLLGIGIFGLITFYLLSNFLPSLYQSFGNKEISIQTTELIVYTISILLLLIQTFFFIIGNFTLQILLSFNALLLLFSIITLIVKLNFQILFYDSPRSAGYAYHFTLLFIVIMCINYRFVGPLISLFLLVSYFYKSYRFFKG